MLIRILKLYNRGDTIVEVMVVLAIIGLALGISFATANRSLLATRAAQENSQATELLQEQLEQLRALSGSTIPSLNIFTQLGPFCIDTAAGTINTSPPCIVGAQPYKITIAYAAASDTFTAVASWDDVQGQGTDTVTLEYRLHP